MMKIKQSHAFIDALKRLAVKYPEETEKCSILSFIDSAECTINDEPTIESMM